MLPDCKEMILNITERNLKKSIILHNQSLPFVTIEEAFHIPNPGYILIMR